MALREFEAPFKPHSPDDAVTFGPNGVIQIQI